MKYALPMGTDLNDTALMLRYQDGDMVAFEELYGRHRGPLFRFLLRQIGNQQFAEDVFQEVWGRIIRNRAGYRPTAKFTTYIYHVARNCSVDHYRRMDKQRGFISASDAGATEPVASTGNPVAEAATRDTRHALTAALSELPAEQREAFLLREESGLSLEEIATATGVGRETVKSRLRYALGKLRQCLPQPEGASVGDD
jgi:RNA polymerase sigma-70 factor (ECF subfamily)